MVSRLALDSSSVLFTVSFKVRILPFNMAFSCDRSVSCKEKNSFESVAIILHKFLSLPFTLLNIQTIVSECSLRKHAHAIYKKIFGCKNEKFHWKNFDVFLIFAQNIDCGYTLEPPR